MEDLTISEKEAEDLIKNMECSLSGGRYDSISVVFPEGRKDVCAVRMATVDGHSFGCDSIYLVWKDASGINQKKIFSSGDSRRRFLTHPNRGSYIFIEKVEYENGIVAVEVKNGGSADEQWKETFRRRM